MRKCSRLGLFGLGLIALAGARAGAQTVLTAHLSNGAENPPTVPTLTAANGGAARAASFGDATFTINAAQTSMTMDATIFNIDFGTQAFGSGAAITAIVGSQTPDTNDDLKNAHIHAGASVIATTNGNVVWGFFGSPFNDNNPFDATFTPFTTPGAVGGTVHGKWDAIEGNGAGINLTSQLGFLTSGHAYINFHTGQFGGGEIRGNIVPEPTTVTMLLGAVFLGLSSRRRGRSV